MRLSTAVFGLGLLVALGAGALLFLGLIDSGPAAMVGIVGIGLIGASSAARSSRR